MGWKVFTIVINNTKIVDTEKLLIDLGYSGLTKIEDKAVDSVLYPDEKKVYIGKYNNNIVICERSLPYYLIKNHNSDVAKYIQELFPDSEVCSMILLSVVNAWGYAVFKPDKTKRVRLGDNDNGTTIDIGEPQEEEIELLSKSKLNADGQRTYILEKYKNDTFTEDQVGENFVFSLFKRYIGINLDEADDFKNNTTLTGYSYNLFLNNAKIKKEKEEKEREKKQKFEEREKKHKRIFLLITGSIAAIMGIVKLIQKLFE